MASEIQAHFLRCGGLPVASLLQRRDDPGGPSSPVLAQVAPRKGQFKNMRRTSLAISAAVLQVALIGAGAAKRTSLAFAGEKAGTARELVTRIEKRVHELQPTRAEKRFDEIGWARDIREAERLAKQHGRPVFLFTHDGRMNTGRC